MSTYNGHKNWNHWNVSLWINNDEGLYNLARQHVRHNRNKNEAAANMLDDLNDMGYTETPDGAKYSLTTIRAAMVDM